MDRPNIRLSTICPLCCKAKDQGLLACWPCFRASGLRYCPPAVEAKLDEYEAQLVRNRKETEPCAAVKLVEANERFRDWLNTIDARHGYDWRRMAGSVDDWRFD